jgi:hypothetical protein
MRDALTARVLLTVALLAASASPVFAQAATPSTEGQRELGPLSLTPSLELTFGTDTNVFNESEDPKRDVTGMFKPQVDAALRLGRGRMSGKAAVDFVYFRDFQRERSINTYNSLRLELPLNRLKPYVGGSFVNTRQRSNFEIDLRARRIEHALLAGLDIGLTSRTTVALSASRQHLGFQGDSVFLGTSLREMLNRHVDQVNASLRYALTPLTTFVATAGHQRDRFEFVPSRNSTNLRIVPGLEFSAFALITGKASVGVCKFETGSFGPPSYTGVVAAVDLATTIRGATRLGVRADRDVVFSFDVRTPYYVLTGLGGSITQRITPTWDVFVWVNRQRYGYRTVDTALPAEAGRSLDAVHVGAGIGYWVGRRLRFGVNADYFRRDSQIVTLGDSVGVRVSSSVTYGL